MVNAWSVLLVGFAGFLGALALWFMVPGSKVPAQIAERRDAADDQRRVRQIEREIDRIGRETRDAILREALRRAEVKKRNDS